MDNNLIKKLYRDYQQKPTVAHKAVLVKALEPLVVAIANKFNYRGEELKDLIQIGQIGLLKAIDLHHKHIPRYFMAYFISMITGEIKHYYRDNFKDIRLPRKYIELAHALNLFLAQYGQKHKGAKPRISEIAKNLQVSQEFVLETLEALNVGQLTNMKPDLLPQVEDTGDFTDRIDTNLLLDSLLNKLPYREYKILQLYFLHNVSQRALARRFRLSQAHIFRLLEHAIKECKGKLDKNVLRSGF